MERNFEPFEVVEKDGRTILGLYGTGTAGEREEIEACKIDIIYYAMRQGWDIDIRYADIKGDIDIKNAGLEMDEEGGSIIPAAVRFFGVNFQKRADFSIANSKKGQTSGEAGSRRHNSVEPSFRRQTSVEPSSRRHSSMEPSSRRQTSLEPSSKWQNSLEPTFSRLTS